MTNKSKCKGAKQILRAALRNDKQMQEREADSSRKGALRMTLSKLLVRLGMGGGGRRFATISHTSR